MYLKKLELHGFKSFAKKTLLTFEPGITSIVGPNGSGKSNLADALRWVFGEQSMKLLRSRKTEDVIFAGSDKKARLGGAEMAIYFDNSDHQLPIDYEEVVIGRRLYRNGTSEYLINGSVVRLLDLQELLSQAGLGHGSYHVIGQGMIDQLILGGPAAIKDLVEEAAGIKPYYVKRERALRRLLRTDTNLEQVEALVREIAPRLKSLRRQTRKLERREEVHEELLKAQRQYFGLTLGGLKRQIQEVGAKIGVFDKQIGELMEESTRLSQEIEQEEVRAETGGQSFRAKREELEKLRKTKQELLEEQAALRGRLKAGLAAAEVPAVDWPKFRERLQMFYEQFRKAWQEVRDKPMARAAWEPDLAKLEAVLQELLGELDNKFKRSAEVGSWQADQRRMEELEGLLGQLEDQINELEKYITSFVQEEEGLKKQLFVKERLLRNKQEALLKTRDQKNELSVEQARMQTRLETVEQEARTELGAVFAEELKQAQIPATPAGLGEKIIQLKKELETIGGVDDLTLAEYRETEERYQHLTTQSKDLEKAAQDLRQAISELDQVIKTEFNQALSKIADKFSEYFRVLFGGGQATMTPLREPPPEDLEEELEEELIDKKPRQEIVGIQIRATPPGKKLSGIAALSGGERALTSIALLSALLAAYPSPFVILDEVDAALDEANSIRFGKILGSLAQKTQFITITHNRESMRQSHTLYGVTMGEDGASRVLSLKLEQAAVYSSKN